MFLVSFFFRLIYSIPHLVIVRSQEGFNHLLTHSNVVSRNYSVFHYDHLCDTVARSVVVVFVLILSFTKKGGVMITEGVAVAIDIGVVSHFSFTFTAVIGATDTVLFP